jgi:hypothetical protein
MRKITRPGQAAIAAGQKDEVIDVDGEDTSAFPRAAGGLRKLFQIPAAANGGEPAADTKNGAGNGTKNGAAKGATTKGSPAKGSSTKGAQAKGTPATSSTSSSGSGATSGTRRKNNKKRKRR